MVAQVSETRPVLPPQGVSFTGDGYTPSVSSPLHGGDGGQTDLPVPMRSGEMKTGRLSSGRSREGLPTILRGLIHGGPVLAPSLAVRGEDGNEPEVHGSSVERKGTTPVVATTHTGNRVTGGCASRTR